MHSHESHFFIIIIFFFALNNAKSFHIFISKYINEVTLSVLICKDQNDISLHVWISMTICTDKSGKSVNKHMYIMYMYIQVTLR